MEKKNRFVFNIGFNKKNPDHVKVAEMLNRMGHVKADYLVRAVLFYEENIEEAAPQTAHTRYQNIENIVMKILSDQKNSLLPVSHIHIEQIEDEKRKELEETDMKNVLQTLDSFRNSS